MTDYISQAYRNLSIEEPESSALFFLYSLVQGTLNLLYAIISALSIVFLQKLIKETQDYSAQFLLVITSILVFRRLSNHFMDESIKYSVRQTKRAVEYLMERDVLAINFRHEGLDMEDIMRKSCTKDVQTSLLGSPYRKYLEENNRLDMIRGNRKRAAKALKMVSSLLEFVLLFMLKIMKNEIDIWQFQSIVTLTLFIKALYLFGFQVIYGIVIKGLVLQGQTITIQK